jgi:DNA-binding HxlR family transcriptional regulator
MSEFTWPASSTTCGARTNVEIVARTAAVLAALDSGEKSTTEIRRALLITNESAFSTLARMHREGLIHKRVTREQIKSGFRTKLSKVAYWSKNDKT